jgi:hypothetical protein
MTQIEIWGLVCAVLCQTLAEGARAVSGNYGKHSLREDVVRDRYEYGFRTS